MRIVTPIKAVASLDDEFSLEGAARVDPGDLQWELNEWDSFSLELALGLVEQFGGEVVVVTVGDDDASDALLSCLARGATRAVRVWDDGLENADPLAIARVLGAVVGRESPDLVLCGAQSSDAVNGATGVALAAHLGVPHVAVVTGVRVEGDAVLVDRELEGGLVEIVRLPTPALLTVQTGINEPRYATLRAIKQAGQKPTEVLGLSDLGLDMDTVRAAAGGVLRRLTPRPTAGRAEMLTGPPPEIAQRIATIVRERISA